MNQSELKLVLELHNKWLLGEEGGERANLQDANLRGADLWDANLQDANLRGADLWDANLRSANLRSADLWGANLRGADLWRANLWGANLEVIKQDLYRVISVVPNEVPKLLETLKEGKIDGSVYEGDCACLVGTIANIKECEYKDIEGIVPDSSSPIEKWFLAIREDDTPENNPVAKITAEWIEEWLERNKVAVNVHEE